MLCSINETYLLADGTLAGGFALTGLRLRMERIFETVIPLPVKLTEPPLNVGMAYKIVLYNAGDDFTNVGGTNVTGNIFVATGTTPANWAGESILVALSPAMLDRNKRRCSISFVVARAHASIKDAEDFCLSLDEDLPRTGDVKLVVSVYGIVTSSPYALIVNGVVLSHELVKQIGSYTEHQYTIAGSPLFSVIPDVPTYIDTEGGDRITTESGDRLVIE